jgi:hypothetical protein
LLPFPVHPVWLRHRRARQFELPCFKSLFRWKLVAARWRVHANSCRMTAPAHNFVLDAGPFLTENINSFVLSNTPYVQTDAADVNKKAFTGW